MKSSTKQLFKTFVFPAVYTVLIIALAAGCFAIFQERYYMHVYIDGKSMQPTLNADVSDSVTDSDGATYTYNVNFGYTDTSKSAINQIQRFSIVTCLYPWDSSDYSQPYTRNETKNSTYSYKIKRVIALPGETFKIGSYDASGVLSASQTISIWNDSNSDGNISNDEWIDCDLPDNVVTYLVENNKSKLIEPYTLGEDEYWVMGDNWGNSTDSSSVMSPIYYENITGVLVAIQGTCTIKRISNKDTFTDYVYYSKPVFYF